GRDFEIVGVVGGLLHDGRRIAHRPNAGAAVRRALGPDRRSIGHARVGQRAALRLELREEVPRGPRRGVAHGDRLGGGARAEPASFMIARTSAKSRSIRPGTVMMSLIPWTPWRRTSSTTRNASRIEVFFWTTSRRRSLGIVMSVSTFDFSASAAFSAVSRRL